MPRKHPPAPPRPVTGPDKKITIAQAAKVVKMTPSGLYSAIRRGDIKAYKGDGPTLVSRNEVRNWRRQMDFAISEMQRKARGDLTDDELYQRMIDNDPD